MNRYCERKFEAGSLTREQFINFLAQDLTTAKMVYDGLERTRVRKEWREAKIIAEQRFRDLYSNRYKKQSTIDRYVAKEMPKWIENNQWRYKFFDLNSVKFSIKPWDNGGCYYVYIDKNMNEYLGRMWDMHVDNKYLQGCTGWAIILDKHNHYLKLDLSDELEAQWKEDERKLSEAISRFYAGTTYWGD